MSVRATPFHGRAAEANPRNAWTLRNGYTLGLDYGDANDEALAARTRVAFGDISWRWRVAFEGARAAEFLSRLATRDASKLEPGKSLKALWLTDNGAVRGAGLIARYGRETFRLVAAAPDRDWIMNAAQRFGLAAREIAGEGGLSILGPYARALIQSAGIAADLEPLDFKKLFWRGLDITLSRWGEFGGYEIWCNADDAIVVWDRIVKAGAAFAIAPMGLAAMDVLDIEAGIARPLRDWQPAEDGFGSTPTPSELGLESLIAEDHPTFNGRAAFLAAAKAPRTIAGIEIGADMPAPFTPLTRNGVTVGHTMSSAWSPALRRAIALARLDRSAAEPGTALALNLPPSREVPEWRNASARVVPLPFLPAPDSLPP